MRIKFTVSVASQSYAYDYGEIAEVPDEKAREFIRYGKAVEVVATACPHCGGAIEDREPEAAALAGAGERATLPGARKRG